MVVDAMSGMAARVRLPRRDGTGAYGRVAVPLWEPGTLQPSRHTESSTHEYASIATGNGAD